MLIAEAVLAFASKDVRCNLRNILCSVSQLYFEIQLSYNSPKSNRREFMVLSNRKGKYAFLLGLLRIEQENLGVESSSVRG